MSVRTEFFFAKPKKMNETLQKKMKKKKSRKELMIFFSQFFGFFFFALLFFRFFLITEFFFDYKFLQHIFLNFQSFYSFCERSEQPPETSLYRCRRDHLSNYNNNP